MKLKCDSCDQVKSCFSLLLLKRKFDAQLLIFLPWGPHWGFFSAEMPFLSMILLHTSWQFLLRIWFFWTVQTAQFSYGCKINIMLACFNWSKSLHLQNLFHTAHHPWPQKSSLAPALVLNSPGHSGPPLLPFVPPHLSICLSFATAWLWTFHTGSPHGVS